MIEKGDIVQNADKNHHWYPCLIIVDEVKSWGILGYLPFPNDNTGNVKNAFIRLEFKTFEKVSKSNILLDD